MNIVTPIEITDDTYHGGNLAEDDYSAWTAGVTYTRGTYVIVVATHSVYQALRDHDSSTSNSPTAEAAVIADPLQDAPDPLHWVYVSRTNKWKLFDGRPSQKAAMANEIKAVIDIQTPIDTVGIMAIEDCSSVTVQVISGGGTANLTWTPARGVTVQRYQYRARPTADSDWTAWADIPNSDATTNSATITGLDEEYPEYEFQIREVVGGVGQTPSNIASLASGGNVAGTGRVTNLAATQNRVEVHNETRDTISSEFFSDWWGYFFGQGQELDSILIDDIVGAVASDAVIVTLSGGSSLKCGQIIIGLGQSIGDTITGQSGFEGLDFSHIEENIYGDLITVERPATEITRFDVLTKTQLSNNLTLIMNQLRGGKRALWIGETSTGPRGWAYGFLRDWKTYYSDAVNSRVRITINGLV